MKFYCVVAETCAKKSFLMLQAEQAQLQALTEEVEEIKRQVVQSQKWRESQFEVQNRVLQAEVNALKQRCEASAKNDLSILSSN